MAGHSQFANIKHRKGAQDKKRASLFTKLAREIMVAAKTGQADPVYNARLRLAIASAKSNSMPKDRIEAAIKKATSAGVGENYEEVRYEGYAPSGVAVIVETLTDNRHRTVSDVRSLFTKYGGNFGEAGSVSFMFDKLGIIHFKKEIATDDAILEAAIEAGADNCESSEEYHEITCSPNNYGNVQKYLTEKFGDAEQAILGWKPKNFVEVDAEAAKKIEDLIDKLEDLDDVQNVFTNYTLLV
jgi:YebC/PmpR family DNA-binding regulatory protein